MSIRDDGLRAYADLLEANGFEVYEPVSNFDFFVYSRFVAGKECFGYVQKDHFGGYWHSMPIRPSREYGSSMFVKGVPGELTVEAARLVARPTNSNPVVGRQENYRRDATLGGMYRRRGACSVSEQSGGAES